jgi:hypothetical protein
MGFGEMPKPEVSSKEASDWVESSAANLRTYEQRHINAENALKQYLDAHREKMDGDPAEIRRLETQLTESEKAHEAAKEQLSKAIARRG